MRTLPIELLVSICEYMCPHCLDSVYKGDQKSLSRLCQTSRLFRDVAQPILFHFYGGCFDGSRRMFLRTATQRPDLAASGRLLDLTEDRLKNRVEMLDDEDTRHLEYAAECLNLELEPGWTRMDSSIYKGDKRYYSECIEEITADMLITSLPHLEHLGLQWDQCRSSITLTQVFQYGHWAGLPYLRYLQIDHWDVEDCFDASNVRGLLTATPNIESLSMQMCSFYELDANPGTPITKRFPALQRLRKLELSQCSVNTSGLTTFHHFIAACPTLEQVDFVGGQGGDSGWANPRDIMHAMQVCSRTLRSLSLDFRGVGLTIPKHGQIKSLRGFPHLEKLSIDLDSFCSSFVNYYDADHWNKTPENDCLTNILPQSVKAVQILSHEKRGPCEEEMYRLGYECLKGAFPHLKLVTISGAQAEPSGITAPLSELFLSAGVELKPCSEIL